MNALMAMPQPDTARPGREPLEEEIRRQVHSLLASLFPDGRQPQRRRNQRYPFPHLVQLTPVGADGVTPEGETMVVVGKHLSEQGLDFYHSKPLPYRRMVASLEAGAGWISLLIDLTWCRFTRQGWYESGGRFLQSVPLPLEKPA